MDGIKRLQSLIQDVYMPDPGVWDRVSCGVCGTEMHVIRDCSGPTSFVMSMSGSSRDHDLFSCPHREDAWHKQVVALRKERKKTASAKVTALLDEEVKQILEIKEPTKIGSWSY